MNILILGKGYLGTELNNFLNSKEYFSAEVFSKSELDYTYYPDLYNKLREPNCQQPNYDIVINASGYTGHPNIDAAEDNKELCWELNVLNPLSIYDVCVEAQVPLIQISSGCIYNGYSKKFSEKDTPNFGMFSDDSSFYSKTKHVTEMMLKDAMCWMFRIRMPFSNKRSSRNYLTKILNYDNLISMQNSMTCVEDFCEFVYKFLSKQYYSARYGEIYNVVNEGSMEAKQIVELMKMHNIVNKNHKFIPIEKLKTKAKRSNCILSTDKIKQIDLQLPLVEDSIEKAIIELSKV